MINTATAHVLHSVSTFLNVSENWIYPQITAVPNAESRVLCRSTANLETFPLTVGQLVVNPPPWEKMSGIPRFIDALSRRVGYHHAFARLKMSRWRPQLLHAHFGMRGWDSLQLKKCFKIPLVTSFYGYDAWMLPQTEPEWRQRYAQLFATGNVFLVEGPAMRDRLASLGCPPGKIIIQRIGVRLDLLPYEVRDFSSGLKVLMLGRFVEKKGLVDGLRACALAVKRGVDLKVTIVGDASADDPIGQQIKQELKAVAESTELSGKIRFTGFIPLDQTRAVLKTHNVFLCPSRLATSGDAEGGSPVALTEAMATGLLCLGTRHCDIPEVIIDGKTGLLCDEGDITGITEMICAISSPTRLPELTAAGRRHIETNFSLPTQMNMLRSIYEALLSKA